MTPDILPLVHPAFDPVALSLGPVAIRWYGLMYLVAFGLFLLGARWSLRKDIQGTRLSAADVDDFLFLGALGVVLGGRLGYVLFYKPSYYLANPSEILAVWQGGMAFHGGLLGVVLAVVLFAWRKTSLGALALPGKSPALRPLPLGQRFLALGDFVAPLVPLGLAAGRLGNFINGELWGRAADPAVVPWAMVFPQAADGIARHPSQLYQMLGEGLLLFVATAWAASRPRRRGLISGVFLAGYGTARFVVEFFREPDAFLGLLSFGFSMGQWLSLPLVAVGLGLMAYSRTQPAAPGSSS